MALRWSTEKCNPPLPEGDDETSVRETLIWGTMAIDMGEITEKNWTEFYARIHAIELIGGALQQEVQTKGKGEPKPVLIEPKDVKRWIGLIANVVTKTRRQFMSKINRNIDEFAIKAEKEADKV